MNKIIKKRFKCKLCKNKYQITSDMLRTAKILDWYGHPSYHRVFRCPTCGQVYAYTDGLGYYGWYPVCMEYSFVDDDERCNY